MTGRTVFPHSSSRRRPGPIYPLPGGCRRGSRPSPGRRVCLRSLKQGQRSGPTLWPDALARRSGPALWPGALDRHSGAPRSGEPGTHEHEPAPFWRSRDRFISTRICRMPALISFVIPVKAGIGLSTALSLQIEPSFPRKRESRAGDVPLPWTPPRTRSGDHAGVTGGWLGLKGSLSKASRARIRSSSGLFLPGCPGAGRDPLVGPQHGSVERLKRHLNSSRRCGSRPEFYPRAGRRPDPWAGTTD